MIGEPVLGFVSGGNPRASCEPEGNSHSAFGRVGTRLLFPPSPLSLTGLALYQPDSGVDQRCRERKRHASRVFRRCIYTLRVTHTHALVLSLGIYKRVPAAVSAVIGQDHLAPLPLWVREKSKPSTGSIQHITLQYSESEKREGWSSVMEEGLHTQA